MKITNTTEEANRDPISALFTGMPGGIEAQEAHGQRELLASDVLPVRILQNNREQYEELGFVFGKIVDGDPLFQHATLPKGWKRQGSDHAMWSYLVDERGCKRVAIFYKAAFYDRRAHMSLSNVGYELASDFIWGTDAEPKIPEGLTPAEIEQAKAACTSERGSERQERADKLVEALESQKPPFLP